MDDFTARPVRQSAFYDLESEFAACQRRPEVLQKYKLSMSEYLSMLGEQGFRCAICYVSFADAIPHIDHDHKTGVVRGVLCSTCNSALGFFRDNIVRLETAIQYLKRSRRKNGSR